MIRICALLSLILCLADLRAAISNRPPAHVLPASALHPFGRFVFNKDHNLEMISSAMHFGFSFDGTECRVFASIPKAMDHNYLQYELDGVYQERVKVSGNSSEPTRITAPKAGRHIIWIYKATEAHTGPIVVSKIEGQNLKVIRNPPRPVIEFIGNSITCGAAADASDFPCGVGEYHDHHNAYDAYGPRVARALHANFLLSSVSGIGVYRNWNSDGPTMPEVYEQADFQVNGSHAWAFSTYAPKVVSIALGTNDLSHGDGFRKRLPFDSAAFTGTYIKFVQLVKSKYPKAQIALLNSPMAGGKNGALLQHCLQAVKQHIDAAYPSNKPVALFFFEPMQPHGCSGHPSVEDHAILAKELVPFFERLLR